MKTINNQISIELNNLMKERGLNVSSLALLSGVSERTINKILNSDTLPSIQILTKLCNVFCINTCQFFDIILNNSSFKKELLA